MADAWQYCLAHQKHQINVSLRDFERGDVATVRKLCPGNDIVYLSFWRLAEISIHILRKCCVDYA